mmetsp:Transcript_24068/g.71448  ORF Transcript_24068/g.71448 Transcript_24068/m.71448 type:complete len:233 (-) Transcript_24068:889-1587(-)
MNTMKCRTLDAPALPEQNRVRANRDSSTAVGAGSSLGARRPPRPSLRSSSGRCQVCKQRRGSCSAGGRHLGWQAAPKLAAAPQLAVPLRCAAPSPTGGVAVRVAECSMPDVPLRPLMPAVGPGGRAPRSSLSLPLPLSMPSSTIASAPVTGPLPASPLLASPPPPPPASLVPASPSTPGLCHSSAPGGGGSGGSGASGSSSVSVSGDEANAASGPSMSGSDVSVGWTLSGCP